MGIATPESTYAIGFCFPIICAVLIALRFYTRKHQKAEIQIDDWLCLPAWVCLSGACACLLTGEMKGAFKDQPISSPELATPAQRLLAQVVFALVKLWVIANFFIKLTILFFYRRIFIGRIFNIATWTLIGLSSLWAIYAFIASVLYCGTNVHVNAEGGWAVCPMVGFRIQMGTFVWDSVIDFCLLVLPIPFVWKLQLSLSKKIIIVGIFILGGFAFVAGLNNTVVQLVELLEPAVAAKGSFFQGSWLLFYNWPVIEIGVGLIACNLPVISHRAARSLLESIRKGWRISWPEIRSRLGGHSSSSGSRRRSSGTLVGISVGTTTTDGNKEWYGQKRKSKRASRGYTDNSTNSLDDIPLVGSQMQALPYLGDVRPEGAETRRYALEPVRNEDGKLLRRDDIV